MLIRNFEPDEIFIRCRKCHKAHPKSDFPTIHRVCNECAHNMNWLVKNRKTGEMHLA